MFLQREIDIFHKLVQPLAVLHDELVALDYFVEKLAFLVHPEDKVAGGQIAVEVIEIFLQLEGVCSHLHEIQNFLFFVVNVLLGALSNYVQHRKTQWLLSLGVQVIDLQKEALDAKVLNYVNRLTLVNVDLSEILEVEFSFAEVGPQHLLIPA